MIEKEFSKEQVEEMLSLACQRHNAKHLKIRNTGPLNKAENILDPKQYKAHFTGIIGEFLWAETSNQQVDKRIFSHGDKEDFKDEEVKTVTFVPRTSDEEPELKIPIDEFDKKNHIKKYILIWANGSTVDNVLASGEIQPIKAKLLGTISREDFKLKCKKFRYRPGYPLNYIVKASQLDSYEHK
jgi:hypothetical protein